MAAKIKFVSISQMATLQFHKSDLGHVGTSETAGRPRDLPELPDNYDGLQPVENPEDPDLGPINFSLYEHGNTQPSDHRNPQTDA